MERIVFATHNAHKAEELAFWFNEFLPNRFEVVTSSSLGLPDPEENGTTFAENAFIKADAALKSTGCISVADDSGLCVDALGGAPGVYSARYAGENASSDECIDKLLEAMRDVPYEKRTARFVSCICMLFPDGRRIDVCGNAEGMIIDRRIGSGTFGYDPVFFYPPMNKTFAEMDVREKNIISHRGKALNALREKLTSAPFAIDIGWIG